MSVKGTGAQMEMILVPWYTWQCLEMILAIITDWVLWAEARNSANILQCSGQSLVPPTKNYLTCYGKLIRLRNLCEENCVHVSTLI